MYDQGQLGSCTGNGISGVVRYDRHKQGLPDLTPSRLFIYYNEREMEDTIPVDAGASIRDGIKSINTMGVCDESLWPYDISKFTVKPSTEAYLEALMHESVVYRAVSQTEDDIFACLTEGYPIVFGTLLYPAFESVEVACTGIVPLPDKSTAPIGGHCMAIYGGSRSRRKVYVLNSWGENWGQKGFCTMELDAILDPDLTDDLWMIQTIAS